MNVVSLHLFSVISILYLVWNVIRAKIKTNTPDSCMTDLNIYSFEDLMRSLRSESTISLSKACVERVYRLSTSHSEVDGSQKLSSTSKVNVRVFLAAYMIVCFPAHVFESMGLLEQILLQAARHLLETFEKICFLLQGNDIRSFTDLPRALTDQFPAALAEYLSRFSEWKEPDQEMLVGRIERALFALVRAQRQLGTTESPEAVELLAQTERLRAKLLQLGGAEAVGRFEAAAAAAFQVSHLVSVQ
jgi:hypothetical protein